MSTRLSERGYTETPAPRPRRNGGGFTEAHKAVNRALATVVLLLSIVALAALIYYGWKLDTALDSLGESLSGLTSLFNTPDVGGLGTEEFVPPYEGGPNGELPEYFDPEVTDGTAGNETD